MTRPASRPARPRRRTPEKRAAITRAARAVFCRVGYQRASIESIAAVAGVSTRTIYNHFPSKETLFSTVLIDSSRRVAASHEALIERHLSRPGDLETALIRFGVDWVRSDPDLREHTVLLQRAKFEAEHLPSTLYEEWLAVGPLRVERTLADRLERLAAREGLDIDDPRSAARHLAALVSAAPAGRFRLGVFPERRAEVVGVDDVDAHEIEAMVTAGVRVFLRGYLPRT